MSVRTDTVEACLDRMVEAWDAGNAAAFADEFTVDASYVIYVGERYSGRAAIEKAHVPVFERWQRGSTMRMRVLELRELAPDVVVAVTEGGIGKGQRIPLDKVQTFTMVRVDGRWQCAAFQNTKKNRFFLWMSARFSA